MKIAFFSILLCFCLCYGVKSQVDFRPGFIVTLDNDTIHGFVDLRDDDFNVETCSFKTEENGEKHTYAPGDIKAYAITDLKLYESRIITIDSVQKTVFLELIARGKLNVYYYVHKNKPGFFVEKENENLLYLFETQSIESDELGRKFYVEHKEYRGPLTYYLRDLPDISQRISNIELKQKSLINLARDYQEFTCPDQECIIYKKENKLNVYGGLVFGHNYNMLRLHDYTTTYEIITPANGFLAGLTFDFTMPDQWKSLFGNLSLYYFQVEHGGNFKLTEFSQPHVHFKYNGLAISYGAFYYYNHYNIQPFAGVSFYWFYNS